MVTFGRDHMEALTPVLPGGTMSKTVLIADDSQILRDIVKDSLSMWAGIDDFEEAADGKEAIERVMEHKPDVIILDLEMPKMNGIEAARILKSVVPDIPLGAVHHAQLAR
jgi:CheY-like chemotaxis protein